MIPTLSSRRRPGASVAAYWRRHPPTSWLASQALLLEESVAQPQSGLSHPLTEFQVVPSLLETATAKVAAEQVAPDQGGSAETPPAPAQQPLTGSAPSSQGGWLPLLVWALVLVIDGAMALKELAGPWLVIWPEKAPWNRREGRAQGAIRGGWPAAPVAGLH